MAGLDIAENAFLQDGLLRFRSAGATSTFASRRAAQFGERAVLLRLRPYRCLSQRSSSSVSAALTLVRSRSLIPRSHCSCGHRIRTAAQRPRSYAALSRLNCEPAHIITIEDPIEYQLHGVARSHVNPKHRALRSPTACARLRQYPTSHVGEIRDG